MTSINALKVNSHCGILICDEASYWNDEWMILYTPDKIQALLDTDLQEEFGVTLFLGMAGSSFMGEGVILQLAEQLKARLSKRHPLVKQSGFPITLSTIARWAFEQACTVKKESMNHFLRGKFGFTIAELTTGKAADGTTIADELLEQAREYLTFDTQASEVSHLFRNTLFLAGYTPEEGFQMYLLSTSEATLEPVDALYITGGSGSDSADLAFSRYATTLSNEARETGIPFTQAMLQAMTALISATRLSAGVEPYPNILIIDADAPQLVRKIFDWRSKLMSEAVALFQLGFLQETDVISLIDELLDTTVQFSKVSNRFDTLINKNADAAYFLRGYAVPCPQLASPAPFPRLWR